MMINAWMVRSGSQMFMRRRSMTLVLLLCGGLGLAANRAAEAQSAIGTGAGVSGQANTRQNGSASNGSPSLLDTGPSPFPDNSRQKRNEERQRRLVSDTQKLVALTAQLKDEIAASNAEAMTPEMLKQMDEIEKLAKSVKDKMRD